MKKPPPPADADATRAALALWLFLALLVLVRAALAFDRSMWGWGANILRFEPPVLGWGIWILCALALVPFIARALMPLARFSGNALAAPMARAWLPGALLALVAAIAVWNAPDRTSFVGDSLLRLDAARAHSPYATTFPQALPLDTFFHSTAMDWIAKTLAFDPRICERALGALKAAALVTLAIAFARQFEFGGNATLAIVLIATFTGALGLFTGYAKGLSELCVVAAGVTFLSLRVVRTGKGLVALGLLVMAGLFLHRGAIAFMLPWVVAIAFDLRRPGRQRPGALELATFALPPLALILQASHLARIAATVDRAHVMPAGGFALVLARAFSALHLLDLVNLALQISPLVLVAPLLLMLLRLPTSRRAEGTVLAASVVPWLAVMLLVHPRQELVRDWDVFGAAGVTLSFLTAWLVGETLRRVGAFSWLGIPAILIAAAPVVGWIASQAELQRGTAYVLATLEEAPVRPKEYRARTLHYLGDMETRLGHYDRAAELMRSAAELGPSDAFLKGWANAEMARGNMEGAALATRRLAQLHPQRDAFEELARIEYQLGNLDAARGAVLSAARLAPGDSAVDFGLHFLHLTWADTLQR